MPGPSLKDFSDFQIFILCIYFNFQTQLLMIGLTYKAKFSMQFCRILSKIFTSFIKIDDIFDTSKYAL